MTRTGAKSHLLTNSKADRGKSEIFLLKFRCSDDESHIERGIHKPRLASHACVIWLNNLIEDEARFITECSAYLDFRMVLPMIDQRRVTP